MAYTPSSGQGKPGSAMARYQARVSTRQPYLDRFIETAKLTDRTLYHEPGEKSTESITESYQSTGARGVDYLTAALLLALFPPNIEVVRLEADPVLMRLISGDPKEKVKADSALSLYSTKIADEVDALQLRGPMTTALKHVLVGGNGLFYLPVKGFPRFIPLCNYVQERDPSGRVLEIIVCEAIAENLLPEKARKALHKSKNYSKPTEGEEVRTFSLYTVIQSRPIKNEWDLLKYDVYQEIEDEFIDGSDLGPFDEETVPFISFGGEWVGGEHYSRSRVERFAGALNSIEGLSQVLLEGTAILSKVVFTNDPSGLTDADDFVDAPNGGVIPGRTGDIQAVQTNKTIDLSFAAQVVKEIDLQVGRDFGLTFMPRSGERVTAEEIRVLADQLDRGLGGLYSHFSNTIQRPVFHRIMYRLEKRGEAPAFPMRNQGKQIIKPRIVTGLEALGRGNDAARLQQLLNDLGLLNGIPPEVRVTMNMRTLVQKLCLARGVSPEEILKDESQIAQDLAAEQQREEDLAVAPEMVRQGGQLLQGQMSQPSA